MTVELTQIPTIPIMGRSLIAHDPESRNFPVRGILMAADAPLVTKSWYRYGSPYDQGQTSSCVGQTFTGVLNTKPAASQIPIARRRTFNGLDFYHGAQTQDEWPGQEPSYYGTSALGMCKWLKNRGDITEYRWCFGLQDVLQTLSHHGPVGVGLSWTERMMTPTAQGFVVPEGAFVGGHETELLGINVKGRYVIGINSWGPDWGPLKGRFKISWDDLDKLLKDQGDAVTIVSVVNS